MKGPTLLLEGKTVLITGGNRGIGKETSKQLLKHGARVIMACRNIEKAEETRRELKAEVGGELEIVALDLASLASVRDCASTLILRGEKIHILINNAAIMGCPYTKTVNGLEMQFGVNHVGHFLLTKLLLPTLIENAPSRIITVSGHIHYIGNINFEDLNSEKSYGPVKAYANSKLANILFSKELAVKLQGTGVTTYSLHPGVVQTELGQHFVDFSQPLSFTQRTVYRMFKSPSDGARTTIYCAVTPALAQQTGKYYSGCGRSMTAPQAWSDGKAKRLWQETEDIVAQFSEPIRIS